LTTTLPITQLTPGSPGYPASLGTCGPALYARGNLRLLERSLVGVFSSVRASGAAVLRAIQWARTVAKDSIGIVSGFHAPLEQECLGLFLRNGVPAIVCVAREIAAYRVPSAWRPALDAGNLLLLTSFAAERRVTSATSQIRNQIVVSLANEIVILHAEPGSKTDCLAQEVATRGKPLRWLG